VDEPGSVPTDQRGSVGAKTPVGLEKQGKEKLNGLVNKLEQQLKVQGDVEQYAKQQKSQHETHLEILTDIAVKLVDVHNPGNNEDAVAAGRRGWDDLLEFLHQLAESMLEYRDAVSLQSQELPPVSQRGGSRELGDGISSHSAAPSPAPLSRPTTPFVDDNGVPQSARSTASGFAPSSGPHSQAAGISSPMPPPSSGGTPIGIRAAKKVDEQLGQQLAVLQEQIQSLQTQNTALANSAMRLQEEITLKDKEIVGLRETQIPQHTMLDKRLVEEKDSLQSKVRDLELELSKKGSQIEDLNQLLDRSQEERHSLIAAAEAVQATLQERLKEALSQTGDEEKVASLEAVINDLRKQEASISSKHKFMQTQFNQGERVKKEQALEIDKLKTEVENLRLQAAKSEALHSQAVSRTENSEEASHLKSQLMAMNAELIQLQSSVAAKKDNSQDAKLAEQLKDELAEAKKAEAEMRRMLESTLGKLKDQATSQFGADAGHSQRPPAQDAAAQAFSSELNASQKEVIRLVQRCAELEKEIDRKEATAKVKDREIEDEFAELKQSLEQASQERDRFQTLYSNLASADTGDDDE